MRKENEAASFYLPRCSVWGPPASWQPLLLHESLWGLAWHWEATHFCRCGSLLGSTGPLVMSTGWQDMALRLCWWLFSLTFRNIDARRHLKFCLLCLYTAFFALTPVRQVEEQKSSEFAVSGQSLLFPLYSCVTSLSLRFLLCPWSINI